MPKSKLTFQTGSLFRSAEFDGFNWNFFFEDDIYIGVSGFWRLLKDGEISLVSLDHGHQFGLPKPVDLVKWVNEKCRGQRLTELKVNDGSGDLHATMTGGLMLEIFIASTGYETYQFSFAGKSYIGTGGGETAIFDRRTQP
jgi:hypothetical protein